MLRHPLFAEAEEGAPAGAAAPATDAPPPAAPPPDDGPATLLEAVQQGLDVDEPAPEPPPATLLPADRSAPEARTAPEADLAALTVMPEGMRGDHRRAFKQLSDAALAQRDALAQAAQRADQMESRVSAFSELVTETGAQPEQVMAAFTYLGVVNRLAAGRATKEEAQQVIDFLQGEVLGVARAAGIEVKGMGIDPLGRHPDLRKRVDGLDMTEDAALELAAARDRLQMSDAQSQRHAEQMAEQHRHEAQARSVAEAKAQIGEWVRQRAQADIDWPAKDQLLAKQLSLIIEGQPPKAWLPRIQAWYATQAAPGGTPRGRNAPLAPRGSATTGQAREPRDMHDAILQSLAD